MKFDLSNSPIWKAYIKCITLTICSIVGLSLILYAIHALL